MKILIVEDDLVIAESLANELSKWNYEVNVVENFDQIMEDFRETEPQLVLLDINLPTLNGFHWCQEMRKESNVPIMFISSRTDNMDQIMALEYGADDYIIKPFDIEILIAKIICSGGAKAFWDPQWEAGPHMALRAKFGANKG